MKKEYKCLYPGTNIADIQEIWAGIIAIARVCPILYYKLMSLAPTDC
jgi:hypothetical protein